MKKILLILTLIPAFLQEVSGQQSATISLSTLTVKDNLVSNRIHDIYIEECGIAWFAGEAGMSRFDGYECFNYSFGSMVEGLESSIIVKIVPIEKEIMWLLTKSRQVLEFYPQSGEVSLLNLHIEAGINDVVPLSEGKFYLGTTEGLYLFDSVTETCTLQRYKTIFGGDDKDSIRTLYMDRAGNLWIGTWGNGIFVIEHGGVRVKKIALDGIAPEAKVNAFCQSPTGHILAATWADGLLEINTSSGIVTKVTAPLASEDKGWNIIYTLCYDADNNLFMGTPQGIWKIDSDAEHRCYTSYVNGSNDVSYMAEVFKIYCGPDSDLWISQYEGGVSRVLPPDMPFEYVEFKNGHNLGNRINSIFFDPHNQDLVWFGVQGVGAVLYDNAKKIFDRNRFRHVLRKVNNKANSIKEFAYCVATDQLFLATRYDGLYIASYEGTEISSLEKVSLPHDIETRCGFLAVDRYGNAFVTLRSGGMFAARLNPSDGRHSYLPMDVDRIVNTAFVTSMIFDSEGDILMGTENNGLLRLKLDYDSFSVKSYDWINLPENGVKVNVLELYCDSRGIVWVGTNKGLLKYDPSNGELTEMLRRSKAHFPYISQIAEDRFGNLWMSGPSYIIRYSPYSISGNYDYAFFKTPDMDVARGVIATSNSMIAMGGSKGALFFDSTDMPEADNKVMPFISDISVLNQSVLKNKIGKAFPYARSLTVNHDENNITIKFSARPYSYDNSYDFFYMMYPLEEEWQSAPVSQRSVTYSKLSPGNYVFKLRVSNHSEDWSDEEYSIDVKVRNSPWATPWAILFYILLGLLVLSVIVFLVVKTERAERRRLEERLEGQKLTDIYNAKLSFLTNLSHEIFTPVTVITCSLERLLSEDNTYRNSYLLMRANLNRVMRLMQQLMDFSKAETSKLKLKTSFGDLSTFVGNICNDNFAMDNSQNIKLEFSSYPESVVGYFDSEKLDKIMYNLISNAYKYNKPNGMIFVSVSREENNALVKVRDTGYGIEPDTLPHIFEPFNEGERRKYKARGTGIGLSLTKELVNAHKGSITVSSIVNQGTLFCVTFPIAKEMYDESEIEDTMEELQVHADAPDSPDNYLKTILLVEDNQEVLMAMTSVIGIKYNVVTARDGSEALAISKEKMVDLILADYQMPNMNGDELCQAIRSDMRLSHIPIIIISAYSSKEYKMKAFNAGADAYVLKPFDTPLLLAQIRSIIENRRSMTHNFEKSFFVNISELSRNTLDTRFLEKIVTFVKEHLSNPDNNQAMAVALNMSESSMYRKIKSITGMSPQEFFRNLRFKISCEMLVDNSNNIADVAYKLGFSDPKYFSKCFKREFGVTPREFRNNHKMESSSNRTGIGEDSI